MIPAVLACAVLANSAMVPLMPYLLATRFGWELWQVGLYSLAVTVTTILLNRRASALVDRGTSGVLLCAVGGAAQVVAGVAAVAALSHVGFLLLVVPALAAGGATVPVFYAMGRTAVVAAGRDATRFNSVLRVATSAGWVLGPAASFALLGSTGAQTALWAVSAAALAALVVLLLVRRRVEAVRAGATGQVPGAVERPARPDEAVRRRVRSAVTLVFLLSFAHIATTTSLPLLLVEHASVPERATGAVVAMKAFVEMAAILLAPWVLARVSPRMTVLGCAVVAVLAYVTYLLADGWGLAIAASVLEGGYYGLFAAVGLTWVQSLSPDRVGWTTGASMSGIYTGVLLASPISGLVASAWLPGITVLSMAAAGAAAIVAATATAGRSPAHPRYTGQVAPTR
ncbi:MFS transporter [Cellulomonas triticagri]|uniref:MFS transporter n=1 Tax=Cellulomonas triticagri TaxID=2483352 RepID=A0A3M2JH12_9CELL|nr:MFS transporter [Cellulomonas triticagri]